jgi:uncharacterized protein (DUF488 family)
VNGLLTAGHGTANRDALAALFGGADVGLVIDVRRFPGSRRNPDVGSDSMSGWLPEHDIDYHWEARLGGRRALRAAEDTEDPWWRVKAFRAYAAHTRTSEFAAGLDDALGLADSVAPRATLFMCSESLWWRCHRRLISDVLVLLHGRTVEHLGHDGWRTAHVPSAGARVTPAGLRYDSPAAG